MIIIHKRVIHYFINKWICRQRKVKDENNIIAYRCLYNKCEDVQINLDEDSYELLPNTLIITPGNYRVFNNIYSLNKEGFYRFIHPFDKCEQRIVFGGGKMKILTD